LQWRAGGCSIDIGGVLRDRRGTGADNLGDDPILGVDVVGRTRVVRLRGELDLYNSARIREGLDEACAGAPERVVIDLQEVDFVDSTALGVLIEASRKLGDRHGFILAAPGLETRRALEISGLDQHFTLRDSVQEALDAPI
jgi:anti-sigma B factor antagonist